MSLLNTRSALFLLRDVLDIRQAAGESHRGHMDRGHLGGDVTPSNVSSIFGVIATRRGITSVVRRPLGG